MRDRYDEHEVGLDGVEDAVREHASETPAHIVVKSAPATRIFQNKLNGLFCADDEREIQTRLLLRIVVCGLIVFLSASG